MGRKAFDEDMHDFGSVPFGHSSIGYYQSLFFFCSL